MLDRFATRALFWGALSVVTVAGGFLSVGAPLPFATIFSLGALAAALFGFRALHRAPNRRTDGPQDIHERANQLQAAMHANTEGVLLLRAIRDVAGAIGDFEIRDVNASGARLLLSDRDRLVGRRLIRDLPASLHEGLFSRYVDAIASRVPLMEDVRVSRRQFASGWLSHQAVPTGDGVAVTLRDISARKREENGLRRASLTDELTRLFNRRGFMTLADQQLRIARRQDKHTVLMYVDMDDFKSLNDQYGHAEGDRALMAVGRVLRRAVRDSDVVARLGGDEFTIMALDADHVAARIIQRRIEEHIARLNASGELAAPLSLTIGHTRVRPSDPASLTELLARADTLLYARKKRRKLTATAALRASTRARTLAVLRQPWASTPTPEVPPDIAAIARATAVAAATAHMSVPSASYRPTRVA